jgi:hypothetical protein
VSDRGRSGPAARRPVLRRQTRRFQIVRWPLSRRVVTTPVRRIGRLLLFYRSQRRAEPLVLHNRAGFHGLDLVESRNGSDISIGDAGDISIGDLQCGPHKIPI